MAEGGGSSTGGSSTGGAGSGGAPTGGASSGGSAGSGGGDSVCELPFEAGNCLAAFPVYWFDASSGECVERTYGGCGGNDNRFDTQEACETACAGDPAPSCADASDCSSCLATSGCSWTANQCAEECIADASCFGAGNPSAPDCPQ